MFYRDRPDDAQQGSGDVLLTLFNGTRVRLQRTGPDTAVLDGQPWTTRNGSVWFRVGGPLDDST